MCLSVCTSFVCGRVHALVYAFVCMCVCLPSVFLVPCLFLGLYDCLFVCLSLCPSYFFSLRV